MPFCTEYMQLFALPRPARYCGIGFEIEFKYIRILDLPHPRAFKEMKLLECDLQTEGLLHTSPPLGISNCGCLTLLFAKNYQSRNIFHIIFIKIDGNVRRFVKNQGC